ncbi:cysteine and tyrosine-rich protein 1-like isoform X1 [Haliotis rufescens]|uniref:cysteine and tyrosine-rich protein 1-like isoform X1 n=1 Tax=Haliotis rufescens TaxID=6454 RepID=UPI00201EE78F|nr:cysteine and tyrosine-rich protein 1-like isoform X1 [Haliotis rufescens]
MDGVQIGCVILTLATFSHAFQICSEKQFDGTYKTKTCLNSCCGVTYFKYCCSSSISTSYYTTHYRWTTGVIVGIVIGVIAFIGLIVGIIICCVICCRSSQGQSGHVVQNQQQMTVVSGTTNTSYTPGYGYPAQATPGAYPPAPNYAQPQKGTYPQGAAYPPPQGGVYPPPQSAAYPPPQGGV